MQGLLLALFGVLGAGCAFQQDPPPPSGTSVSPEASYCSSVTAYSSPVTVVGKAVYYRRAFTAGTGLGAVEGSPRNIQRAEVRVLSGSTVVQCGETDASGNFSVEVPAGTYTVEVNSRAYNSYMKASVLNDPTNNQHYSLTSAVTATGATVSAGTLTANATGTVLGGAFNILDQIRKANEYLVAKTNGCDGSITGCQPFVADTKVKIYWKLGLSPSVYLGSTGAISYYVRETDSIYLTGGENNDPDNTDTDHFDNAVIIHEYGHFIEDTYSKSDSPGGSHNGHKIIDPRLAFSEGYANYFGVLVNNYFENDSRYRDSIGNANGTSSYLINYDIEMDSDPVYGASRDEPALAGEGNFREFSIARTLYDASDMLGTDDDDGDAVSAALAFAQIWTAFRNMSGTSYHFRNFGLLMELQAALAGATDFSGLLTTEKQRADRRDYGTRDAGSACGTTATMTMDTTDTQSFNSKYMFQNNDFFHFTHPGGTFTATVTRASGNHDFDLYVYRESHTWGTQSTMAAAQATASPGESISTSLSAGEYLVNVMGTDTVSNPGTVSSAYSLTINGDLICP